MPAGEVTALISWIGIVSPTIYAGMTLQDSLSILPIVHHAPTPSVAAKQWLELYQQGPTWVAPLCLLGTAANAILAGPTTDPLRRGVFLAAAAALGAIFPVTFFYFEPGVNGACKWKAEKMVGKETGLEAGGGDKAVVQVPSAERHSATEAAKRWAEGADMQDLIVAWGRRNQFRWVLGMLSAAASGWATLWL